MRRSTIQATKGKGRGNPAFYLSWWGKVQSGMTLPYTYMTGKREKEEMSDRIIIDVKGHTVSKVAYDVSRAAGMDCANRAMRKAGRLSWNEDDYCIASREMNRILDEISE
jgi:hypothetical protein